MKAIRWISVLCGLWLTASAHGEEPVGERHTYKTIDERTLSLYVTKPGDWKPGDSRPAMVFFHGGGWVKGKPGQFTEHSKYFASRGLVCVQVEYRLIDKKSGETPRQCIHDAKSAMRWVRSNAGDLGVDPNRIASAGGSAGGHLAAFVGMVGGMDDPQDDLTVSAKSHAMLLFNPVFDNGPGGYGHKLIADRYPAYSPFHNVSADDPPAIVFLGDQDELIPVETALAFQRQMKAAGVMCEVRIFEDMAHGFFNYGKHEGIPYTRTVIACDEFLGDLGWVQGNPTLEVEREAPPEEDNAQPRHRDTSNLNTPGTNKNG
jgi:acetyl esterase/lipase